MGYRWNTQEIAHPFEAQFRNAPMYWREFVASYLFAQGIQPSDGPEGIKVRDYGPEGEECYRPARWFSRAMVQSIVDTMECAERALAGTPMADDPRVWEVLGYIGARAGIGLDDLDYRGADRTIIQSAADLISVKSEITCYRGIIA